MGFDHRKLLSEDEMNSISWLKLCPEVCKRSLKPLNNPHPLPLPPSPPPPQPVPPRLSWLEDDLHLKPKHLISTSIIIMVCTIGAFLFFGILCAILRAYYYKRNNSRRRNPPIIFDTQEDFLDEDHGPVIDHPIWYINTIGLPQSIIDSITVFKYKKDEGLNEGTECSVCLSEFEEDESLRLLPKCSHAFHIPCIDTWLRSHKNCPLCRAPIVCDAIVAQATASEPNSNGSSSTEEARVENLENQIGLGSNVAGTSEVRTGDDNFSALPIEDENTAENSKASLPIAKSRNCDSDSRVLSDLGENRRVVDEDIQPMRRSVSLDSPTASMIYNAVASFIPDKHQGSSNTQLVQLKPSNLKMVAKKGRANSSLCRLMKSSSIGRSLQRGPISMKRSISFAGKLASSRNCRSQESFLPL